MNESQNIERTIWLIKLICLLSINIFIIIAFLTYSPGDPGWAIIKNTRSIHNAEGVLGAWIADFIYFYIGLAALFVPVVLTFFSVKLFLRHPIFKGVNFSRRITYIVGGILTLSGMSGLLSLYVPMSLFHLPAGSGGVVGQKITWLGLNWLHETGTTIVLLACFFIGCVLINMNQYLSPIQFRIRKIYLDLIEYMKKYFKKSKIELTQSKKHGNDAKIIEGYVRSVSKKVTAVPTMGKTKPVTQDGPMAVVVNRKTGYMKPHISVLDDVIPEKSSANTNAELSRISQILGSKLLDFNVQGEVVSVHPGPVVTRFEFQPAAGIRASKITSLAKDIARSLSKTSVRIVEVTPGKSTVGIEIPNTKRATVRLKEIIESKVFENSTSPLTLCLGKDISGQPVVADLGKMPHLLVAGTTGSGKSVGLNAMLLSLLYKASPDELRLMLIDPKILELSIYKGIPHLLCPVITDMHEAGTALRWCVEEMERRYELMAAVGVRNLASYNEKIKQCQNAGTPLLNPLKNEAEGAVEFLSTMPSIIVLADEFADMIMVVGKQVEQLIARIAQKARAAGIHLILATQRPSVDVITGLIKANIPSRISFQVSSKIDSRTIIDQQGAEQLLGYGDMLYLPPGTAIPIRVHGAYVDDNEVHRVVKQLARNKPPKDFINLSKIGDTSTSDHGLAGGQPQDELYDEAVEIVKSSQRASISYVQRRLKIGYNRAATLVELMQEKGVLSAPNTKGQREVLID